MASLSVSFCSGSHAPRIFAVECRAGEGSVETEHGIKRGYGPIAAKRETHAVVEKGSKGVGRFTAFVSDAFFGPAAVVDGVIGLH